MIHACLYDFVFRQLNSSLLFLEQFLQVIHTFLLLLTGCGCPEADVVPSRIELEYLRTAFFIDANKNESWRSSRQSKTPLQPNRISLQMPRGLMAALCV